MKERITTNLLERIIRVFLRKRERAALHAKDRERLDRSADRLNLDAADVLQYQAREE